MLFGAAHVGSRYQQFDNRGRWLRVRSTRWERLESTRCQCSEKNRTLLNHALSRARILFSDYSCTASQAKLSFFEVRR
jgi:hypothetical protein